MPYDLFISYSRSDNKQGRITELKERIEADYREFAGEPLRCFFDTDDIHGAEDFRHRILQGLRESQLLLLVLSPGYLASRYCEWEIVEYLKYEYSRAVEGQGVAQVYFVEVPGLDTPAFEQTTADWVLRVRRRMDFDLRPWHDEGAAALKRQDVRNRLEDLERTLQTRISKLRRITAAPGNLPAPNPKFIGRGDKMVKLHESAGLGRPGVLTAIHGIGGLGKTALAIQYAYAYAHFYPGGRWLVGCAGQTSVAAAIRQLDCDLGIIFNEQQKCDDERAARRILAELENRARRKAEARAAEQEPPQPAALLLLDNVDAPKLMQSPQFDLLSGKRWLHVIVTTRMSGREFGHDPDRQTLLALDELPLEDAVGLIENHLPKGCFPGAEERAAAEGLAELLGGFTLAVEVVAVYLGERQGQITCAAFLERLRSEGLAGFEGAAKETKRAVSHGQKLIGATLGPTLDLLDSQESLVLAYAALLPPDTIPTPWLRALAVEEHPKLGEDAQPGYDDPWLSLVNHLLGLRLLQVVDIDPDTRATRFLRMHRLVQQVVASRIGDSAKEHRLGEIAKLFFQRIADLQNREVTAATRWEVRSLVELGAMWTENTTEYENAWIQVADGADKEASLVRAMASAGEFFSKVAGFPRIAEAFYNRALLFISRLSAPDAFLVAECSEKLGTLLDERGELPESERYLRSALERYEKLCGADSAQALACLRKIALLHYSKDEYEAAIKLHKAIAQLANAKGFEKLLLDSYESLASTYETLGQLQDAESWCAKAREICTRRYGNNHVRTGQLLNTLGCICLHGKNFADAYSAFSSARSILENSFGSGHWQTKNATNNLAAAMLELGKAKEAEKMLREALKVTLETQGKRHPNYVDIAGNLGFSLALQDRINEAEPLLRDAVEVAEELVANRESPDDTLVADALYMLARGLWIEHKFCEAANAFERAGEIWKLRFGSADQRSQMALEDAQICRQHCSKQ